MGDVKIGFATDVLRRVKTLQTSHPTKLRILRVLDGGKEDERALHERFSALRQTGEWFRYDKAMVESNLGLPDLPIPFGKRERRPTSAWGLRAQFHAEAVELVGLDAFAKRMDVAPWDVMPTWNTVSPQYYSALVLALRDLGYRHVSISDFIALDQNVAKEKAEQDARMRDDEEAKSRKYREREWLKKNKRETAWFPFSDEKPSNEEEAA